MMEEPSAGRGAPSTMAIWETGSRAEDSTAATVASGAGRVGKVLKVAGVIGDVASGGVEAYDQWK